MCKINGKKLGELRVKAGITQKELAKKSGMSVNSIKNYEYGISEPSEENIKKICMVLKINHSDIEIHDVGYNFLSGESKTVQHIRKSKFC